MKLAKLSLAAIVAVGAMTTFASATSLEEAIKGVELNGYLRYRYYDRDNDTNTAADDEHRFTAVTDFTIPVAENLKSGIMLTYQQRDFADNGVATDGQTDGSSTLNVERLWFQYAVDGFSVKAGKIEIFSPWTDPGYRGAVGNGALALYTGVPGWTFGAGAFLDTNLLEGLNRGQENLYAAGALGSIGPVNVQLWGASMTNTFDYSVFAEAGFEMAGFSARAQVNNLKLADEARGLARNNEDSGIYWGVEAGYEAAGFSVGVGYTQNDEDQPIYTLSADDSSGFIFSGAQQINGDIANARDMQAMFIDLGYETGPYSVGAGYTHGEAGKTDLDEFYVEAGYKYSKNFKLSTYYSNYETDAPTGDTESDEIRFEAKYSF